jgi:citrate lyase subunit beta/citryl-CoA lyase
MTVQRGTSRERVRLRSKLFVPGNRPDRFAKAVASGADAVCFDLEDSVPPEEKGAARAAVKGFLLSKVSSMPIMLVQVNDIHSEHFASDLSAVVWPGSAMIVLPKVEESSEIHEAAAALLRLEQERGIPNPIALLPTIESSGGLRRAHLIAAAHGRVAGLQLGLVDLFSSLSISSKDKAAAQYARLQLRFASGEAGVPCFDSAYPAFTDAEGFEAEAVVARDLGFSGKSCIHPIQVAPINAIFSPTAEEIAGARRILEKAREAAAEGQGAFELDGRMVDQPVIRCAEEILAYYAALERDRKG